MNNTSLQADRVSRINLSGVLHGVPEGTDAERTTAEDTQPPEADEERRLLVNNEILLGQQLADVVTTLSVMSVGVQSLVAPTGVESTPVSTPALTKTRPDLHSLSHGNGLFCESPTEVFAIGTKHKGTISAVVCLLVKCL